MGRRTKKFDKPCTKQQPQQVQNEHFPPGNWD